MTDLGGVTLIILRGRHGDMHVVVVGGGIVGVASAYYLACQGAEVTLCERDALGSGSTDRAVGGIRSQFSTPVNVALSQASVEVWDGFGQEFGVDIERRRTGYLFVTRETKTADAFEDQVAMQNERGVPSVVLTPTEAATHCPGLRSDEFVAATYSPDDSFADPHLALQGFAAGARAAGVRIETGTTVIDIDVSDRDSRGGTVWVETDSGSLEGDFVVNAAGAWAPEVGEMVGVSLPIEPHRRQVLTVEPERPVPETDPLTIDLDTTAHFRPERDGRAVVGGHFGETDPVVDPATYSERPDLDWSAEALEYAGSLAEYFGPDSRVVDGWAGLYAVTPDDHPVIERSRPGVVTAAGFSGHGFQHAPATGKVVAELCLHGESRTVDVAPLSNERFDREGGSPLNEQNVA